MPRFYFNVHDGVSFLDTDGVELPSWEAAQVGAVRLAGSMIQEQASRVAVGEDWHMVVSDETGLVLLKLHFSIIQEPAMLNATRQRRTQETRTASSR